MKSTLTRIAVGVLAVAMTFVAMTGAASAQDTYTPGEPQLEYSGPFSVDSALSAAQTQGAFGFPGASAQPSADDGSGGTGGGLALTGSDVELPVALGVALLGVGGLTLVAGRRRSQPTG